MGRLLTRGGLDEEDDGGAEDAFAEEAPLLAGLAAASAQGVSGLPPRAGARPGRRGRAPEEMAPPTASACHAQWQGFDLHAALAVPAGQRDRLERVCRYALRPPIADERLRLDDDGRVVVTLRRPWSDGTTQLVFEPGAFLERLAVLVPRPRINLLLYHGVLAPRAAWRAAVVRWPRAAPAPAASAETPAAAARPSPGAARWADLMRRAFGFDVLACPRCGGRLRLIALLEASAVTRRILEHLGLPSEVPAARPARAPPGDDLPA